MNEENKINREVDKIMEYFRKEVNKIIEFRKIF